MNALLGRLLLIVAVWIAGDGFGNCAHELGAQSPPPTSVQWRRTIHGWERADLWNVGEFAAPSEIDSDSTKPLPPPQVHPIFVAGFMLAAAALMAIGASSKPNRQ